MDVLTGSQYIHAFNKCKSLHILLLNFDLMHVKSVSAENLMVCMKKPQTLRRRLRASAPAGAAAMRGKPENRLEYLSTPSSENSRTPPVLVPMRLWH
ncbi:hypothetical protein [Delftia sp. PS-11]|uniref:hypothetical protein n=1 Tax=Delftia sp. PS-11 TaxID=2767222 RepID=UPI0024559BC8|nr:hypothetical protein [Delftia sp. PS-11]KAJ8743377.1 hypothetical protein H9T68_17925 [Delftia sp. PS-11]